MMKFICFISFIVSVATQVVYRQTKCTPNYCNNNGQCLSYDDGLPPSCECTNEYTGNFCELTKKDCTTNAKFKCGLNSYCYERQYCLCKPSYYGVNCAKRFTCSNISHLCAPSSCIEASDGPICVDQRFIDLSTVPYGPSRCRRDAPYSEKRSYFPWMSAMFTTFSTYLLEHIMNGEVKRDCTVTYVLRLELFEQGLLKCLVYIFGTIGILALLGVLGCYRCCYHNCAGYKVVRRR